MKLVIQFWLFVIACILFVLGILKGVSMGYGMYILTVVIIIFIIFISYFIYSEGKRDNERIR